MSTAREQANWIFMWDDAITEIANVVIEGHSAEVAGYVAENLLDSSRQTCYKTSATGNDVWVGVDLLTDQVIKSFGLHNHDADSRGAGSFSIKYGTSAEGAGNLHTANTYGVPATIGDDDFFYAPASPITARYVRYEFDSIDTANLYLGRMFLAREMYDLPNFVQTGATKGFSHSEEILLTKGGIEHRNSRGNLRRRLTAVMPSESSSTPRDNMIALIEHVQLNHKAFVMSSPYGTSVYSGSLFGAAIHARFNLDDWQYSMLAAGTTQVPLDIIEDL
jgi:hypothetical protein